VFFVSQYGDRIKSHVFPQHHRKTFIWTLAECNEDFASSSPISQGCALSTSSLTAESWKVWRWSRLQWQKVQINFSIQIVQTVTISLGDTETHKLKHKERNKQTNKQIHTHTHTHTQNGGHITLYFSPFWRKKKLSHYRPGQALKAPGIWGPQKFRHMKLVMLSALFIRRIYVQGHTLRTHFCQRLSQPQGHNAAGRIRSMKNFNNPIGGTTYDLPTCSAVPQPTTPPLWRKEGRIKYINFTKVYKKFHTR
jgi:hypothetical protein